MAKYLYLFVFSTLCSISLFGQEVLSGYVLDAVTQEPVVGATVYFPKDNIGSNTDGKGYYTIKIPEKGRYEVKISFVGYKTVRQTLFIEGNQTKNFYLQEKSEALNEVVVIGKSELQHKREKALPITIISLNQIQSAVGNIEDVLSKTAGMTLRKMGGEGSASRISLRGLEGKRVGYFFDGVPMGDRTELAELNDIPIDMIQAIEIYKGLVPAKFGGSAMGGAVNIIEKEYPPIYTDVSYSFGSFNTHKTNVVLKRNDLKRGYEYGLGGYYAYSDNDYRMELPLQPGRFVRRDHDKFQKYTIGGSFTAKRWWFDEVEFTPMFVKTDKEIQGIEYNIQEAENHTWAATLMNHLEKKEFLVPGLELDMHHSLNISQFHFVDTARHGYHWDGSTKVPVSAYGGEIGTDANDAYTKKISYGNKLNLNYVIDLHHSVNLNAVFNYLHGSPTDKLKDASMGYKSQFDSDMNNFVAGLSHEYKSTEDRFLNMSSLKYYMYSMKTKVVDNYGMGNISDINMLRNSLGVSEAVRYKFTPTFMMKASAAYDVRIPSEEELLGDGFLIVPATDLKPERNLSLNIGTLFDAYYGANRLQIDFNAFAMYLDDMIRFTGSTLQSVYSNFGKMRTLGVELDVKCDVTDYLYVYANATYQDLRDIRKKEPGSTVKNPTYMKRMPNIPYLMANGGIELHKDRLFGVKGTNTRLFFDCSFIEEYFYDFEQSVYQQRRIPRSLLFNGGFEYKFCDGKWIVGGQLNNITGERVLSEFNRPLPGRNFAVKLRYILEKH